MNRLIINIEGNLCIFEFEQEIKQDKIKLYNEDGEIVGWILKNKE